MTDYTITSIVSACPGTSRSPSVGAPARPAPTAATARPVSSVPAIRAKYDAAQSNRENAKLWSLADGLSARTANDPGVRETLRNRSRYEVANNSYARGIVETLANDVIGTGPRLQMMTGNPEFDRAVSDGFEAWAAEIGLAEKLRTIKKARTVDGEAFAVFITNSRLTGPVQLDLRLVEADQVTDLDRGFRGIADPYHADGIRFDRAGNPIEYTILRDHPGGEFTVRFGESDRIPAREVIHWFRMDRPGQVRGVPDITPALHLFGLLRRYTLAVLAAAETAADFAAVLESEFPADGDEPGAREPFDAYEIERRMMVTLPGGMKLAQLRAEQPTTTYEMFKNALLNEIARCLNMPFNIAAGNSAGYNYASGRLDHQTYYKSIAVDQYHLETAALDRLLAEWLREAQLSPALAVPGPLRLSRRTHQWFWDGWHHADPKKEADAQAVRLRSGTATLADEWARQGHDWREKADQQAEERAYYASKGIPYPGDATGANPRTSEGSVDDDDDE